MRTVAGVALGIVTGTALGWAVAWQLGGRASGGVVASAAAVSGLSAAEAAFELDGEDFPEADFPLVTRSLLYDGRRAAYDDEKALIEQLAVRWALAREQDPRARLATVPELTALIKIAPPTDAQARKVFEQNRARLPASASFEQVKDEVVAFIKAEAFGAKVRDKARELQEQGRLRVLLDEPRAPEVELPVAGRPVRGDAAAPHVLVEAFDYLCPHCQAIQAELDQLLDGKEASLRFVVVNYSLKPDALSGALARGASCAAKQGDAQFWRFHDEAFAAAKRHKWSVADAGGSDTAADVARGAGGIDVEALRACVDSDDAKAQVSRTNASLSAAGMSGTPTFFLDGRKVSHRGASLRELVARLSAKTKP